MPERRTTTSSSTSTNRPTITNNVRRNLFHQHLSRRPTTSSTSTSAETVRFDQHVDDEDASSEIVIRNGNGEFEVGGDVGMNGFDDGEELGGEGFEEEKERQRLAEMVRRHQRNRAPSEPAELLETVRASLRAKVAALSDDNWMYEPEPEGVPR